MSISSLNANSTSTYLHTPPAITGGSASPVVASTDPGLAQQASALSTTAGIVATLGSAPASSQTYDAAGLYNSIAQAGTSTPTTPALAASSTGNGSNTQGAAQQSANSSVASAPPKSPAASGFYTGTGVLQSTSGSSVNLTANWASALHANPNLAHVVAADSYAQGIVGTLSVTA